METLCEIIDYAEVAPGVDLVYMYLNQLGLTSRAFRMMAIPRYLKLKGAIGTPHLRNHMYILIQSDLCDRAVHVLCSNISAQSLSLELDVSRLVSHFDALATLVTSCRPTLKTLDLTVGHDDLLWLDESYTASAIASFLDLLLPGQCQSLGLSMSSMTDYKSVPAPPNAQLPYVAKLTHVALTLGEFSVHTAFLRRLPSLAIVQIILDNSKSLKTFSIKSTDSFSCEWLLRRLAFESLRQLDLRCPVSISTVLDLLNNLPGVTSLSLTSRTILPDDEGSSDMVSLSCKEMVLCPAMAEALVISGWVLLPQLTSLEVVNDHLGDEPSIDDATTMIAAMMRVIDGLATVELPGLTDFAFRPPYSISFYKNHPEVLHLLSPIRQFKTVTHLRVLLYPAAITEVDLMICLVSSLVCTHSYLTSRVAYRRAYIGCISGNPRFEAREWDDRCPR